MKAIRHVPISDSFSYGWKKTFEHFGFILTFIAVGILLSVGVGILQAILSAAFAKTALIGLVTIIFAIVRIVVNVALGMAGIQAGLQITAGKRPTIASAFKGLTNVGWMLNYILTSIVTGVITFVGFLLLVIPGIYLALRFLFAGVNVVDQKADVGKAISKSGELTDGVKFELLGFLILSGIINVVGLLLLGVGLLITVPMTQIAKLYVYKHLMRKS